jgi:hypothetical protein
MVKYFVENGLLDEFNTYLEAKGCYDVIIDVALANHMKHFIRDSKRTDPTARMALLCRCGTVAGGFPTPSGVRG